LKISGLVLVLFGNALALAGFLLADLPPQEIRGNEATYRAELISSTQMWHHHQEMWPMLASLIVILPFNALECFGRCNGEYVGCRCCDFLKNQPAGSNL